MSLADDLAGDLGIFFNLEEFAVKAVWKGTKEVAAIFEDPFTAAGAAGAEVESSAPVAHVRTADVSGIAQGDTFKIGTVTYTIIGVQPDGTGVTRLILSQD